MTSNNIEVNILNMMMLFGKQHPWDLFFFFNTRHFIIDNFSNYSRHSLLQIPFFVYFVIFSWFVLIDLYISIQSRHSCFLMRLISIIRTLILFFIIRVNYAPYLWSCYIDREVFSVTFTVIFLSLLWTALKLKNQNKEQFVHVSVLFCYYFIN